METTTIIPGLSWGQALDLFQKHGNIRIETSDSETFESMLKIIGLDFTVEHDPEKSLTKYKLKLKTK